MILIFKEDELGFIQPVVIIDYTRSDEQYTYLEIQNFMFSLSGKGAWAHRTPHIYSLDYSASYTHSGINYGKSLKTEFNATIVNAPTELIKLLNVEQYTSQQNLTSMTNAVNAIIDPQVKFPTGGIVFKTTTGETITRKFIIYSTPFNFDSRRINSNLELCGASFDDMVLRLKFDISVLKTNGPLLPQLATLLTAHELTINPESLINLGTRMPAVDKWYSPAPANSILQEICIDNNLAFNNENGIITFNDFDPNSPDPITKNKFSFNNSVSSNIISTFSLQNYVSASYETEIYDAELFSTSTIFDDSKTADLLGQGGIFSNLTKSPDIVSRYSGYKFYILEYTMYDSKNKTSIVTRATNNWIMNNFKLDYFLENKIYQGAL